MIGDPYQLQERHFPMRRFYSAQFGVKGQHKRGYFCLSIQSYGTLCRYEMILFKPFSTVKYITRKVIHYMYCPQRVRLVICKRLQSESKFKAPFTELATCLFTVV